MPNGSAGTVPSTAPSSRVSANVERWAAGRKISAETLVQMPVGSGTVFFPDLDRRSEAIAFRYVTGWKARSIEEKGFVAGKGFKLSFWNIEQVARAKPRRVYITEGEMDALALVEAGISPECVLSVPNGAKSQPADNPREQSGYAYVLDALRDTPLSHVAEFVWCGDGDDAGRSLRADFVRLLGLGRMLYMEWPEGVKDANEMLQTDGPAALRELVQDGCLPWPVGGIYRIPEIPQPPPMTLWEPGFPEWESKVRLAPGTMSVLTGQPGHGKTVLFAQIWFQVARQYDVPIAMAMFETHPRPHLLRHFRSWHSGKLEKHMTAEEVAEADRFIDRNFVFLLPENDQPNLEWVLDRAEVCIQRYGCRVFMIDPWNRLEGGRAERESETDYIGRSLRAIHTFAKDFQVHMQVVAHPSKSEGAQRNQAPMLQDISGSKHWENMCDQGFVVHRPKLYDGKERKTESMLLVRKVRFQPELGYPCKLDLNFDLKTGRFVSTDYEV